MTQYTPEEIINHSVKGGKSNKIQMTSRKPGLDPTIRLAVKGIFRYYLSTRYTDEAYINAEVDKCDDHIRRKISDLRKKARPPKLPKNKKSSSSSDESSDSRGSDSDDAEPKKKSRNTNVPSGSDDSEKAEPKKKSRNASSRSDQSDNSSDHSSKSTSQSGDKVNSKEDEPLGDD